MIGPSYADAIQQDGNIASQIELCINWVKGEASEAVSLIDCCAPHGKPMLAQAQRRLETLKALKLLELVTSQIKPMSSSRKIQ